MKQYLAIAVCNFDDVPLRIFDDEKKAHTFAKRNRNIAPKENPLDCWETTQHLGCKVLEFDCGIPAGKAAYYQRTQKGGEGRILKPGLIHEVAREMKA